MYEIDASITEPTLLKIQSISDDRGKYIRSPYTAEKFAKDAFNGQTPVKVANNVTGEGSWVAILPDGTAVTYRPAGQASSKTAGDTATVEVNSSAVKAINRGEIAKFKFPGK